MPPGPDPHKKPEMKGPPRQPPQGQQPPRPRQPPQRRPPPPRPPPRHRRHHHRGNASHALIGLAVIFVLLRLLDFMFLMEFPPELNRPLLSSVITHAVWTTALLIAIARRKAWARLIFIGFLGLASVSTMIVIPLIFDEPGLTTPFVCSLIVYATSFGWLCYSRDVRRLTGRDWE